MTHVDQLERDENGIPVGDMRLVHEDPSYNMDMGVVEFIDGQSTFPLSGPALARIVAIMGESLDVVPWGDPVPERKPKAVRVVHQAQVEDDDDGPEAEETTADDITSLPSDRSALQAIAEARGIDISRSWGAKKLRAAIRDHQNAY